MSWMRRGHLITLTLPLVVALLGPAAAQSGKPAAVPVQAQPAAPKLIPTVPTEPETTTASYGDWVMRCQRGGGEKLVRVCEAAQTIQVQGQAAPIAQVAVGRAGHGEPLQVTLILPPNVSFPGGVRILAEEKDAAGFDLAWRRCLPGGCVAEAVARDDGLKRWRAASEPGRITYKNAGGQEVSIPLSFRGLAQALDALAKEPA